MYYNRFRYYDPEAGVYISQDPIGLAGDNPNIYAYVKDTNIWIDPWGLIVDNFIRYKPDKATPQPGSRGTAINRAWVEERDLIIRTGKGNKGLDPTRN